MFKWRGNISFILCYDYLELFEGRKRTSKRHLLSWELFLTSSWMRLREKQTNPSTSSIHMVLLSMFRSRHSLSWALDQFVIRWTVLSELPITTKSQKANYLLSDHLVSLMINFWIKKWIRRFKRQSSVGYWQTKLRSRQLSEILPTLEKKHLFLILTRWQID